MVRRDLNATNRILWDFIFGHLIHLHLVFIDCNNQNMIAVIAVRPNVILSRRYPFSPQIEPCVFIFEQNIGYCGKNNVFSIAFECVLKRYLQKEKQVEQFLIETAAYRRFVPIGGWSTKQA
jgi:hypothetical protein